MDHLSWALRMLWSVSLDDCFALAAMVVSGSLPGTTVEDLHGRPYGGHRCASWSLYDRLLDEWLLKLGLCCGFRRIDLYGADEFQAEDIDPGFQQTWPDPLATQVQVELWASRRPNHAGRAVCRSDRSRNAHALDTPGTVGRSLSGTR